MQSKNASVVAADYANRLSRLLTDTDWSIVEPLAAALLDCWKNKKQVFWIGNGGSAGNAIHMANDFFYSISKQKGSGIRGHALAANAPIVTCLSNDVSYDDVFAMQLATMANPGDILIAFSGSGNSPNILNALVEARALGVKSFAILGYSGGKAKALADHPLHFAIDDMQISEDVQCIVCHMLTQYLYGLRETVQGPTA
ncbi:SIS domain-containing protein [Nordella sp. HKS 07]|uniref:SIS domain-containing protein n=1 Tax=Nordella sp. HKS 07 TaxID=2712222 RepID=UPI0013E13B94|nr:SIS domain-containing protein [Nordella sp. HKS 07]QIG52101.1 SIS domain-containing protein [Nordella sp. HKS 07]